MNYIYNESIWISPFPRPMIAHMTFNFANKPIIGVEIGVFKGENAENILSTLNIHKLFLVDSYVGYNQYIDVLSKERLVDALTIAQKRLFKHKDKICWLLEYSTVAYSQIANLLDFVYIDGNHRHEYVWDDLMNYYPLVKSGGFIGGHDYFNDNSTGVKKAVDEFVLVNNLELALGLQGIHSDWWIQKP